MSNPFFKPLPATGIPAFEDIQPDHYREAIDRGLAEHEAEISAIVADPRAPDFDNTIEALERGGGLLRRVFDVFWNLTAADTSDQMQALERAVSPEYAAHRARIMSNPQLFDRVRAVQESAHALSAEQLQLLDKTARELLRSGAALDEDHRRRLVVINERLALLCTEFGQNVLEDTNRFELVVSTQKELSGLPSDVLDMAAGEARARGRSGCYVFTISRSSITPFLQYADNRALRKEIYTAYCRCGADNSPILQEIVALRAERARLLGFATHADFMLDERMAKTPQAVIELLRQVWQPTQRRVAEEAADLQALVGEEPDATTMAPWDWWYYSRRLRQRRFALDEAEIKPYFKLANVRDGAFGVAGQLYGIEFRPRPDVRTYHPDVVCYEVTEANGSLLGYFLVDYFMRASKRSGAWMSAFCEQSNLDQFTHPVIVNCCNFPRTDPCLLTLGEVRTLFHEFGHALHGLLSNVRYRSLGGTNVRQDFVELPSQMMEHWAVEPEVLRCYARHVDTGAVIPEELIAAIRAAACFNQGFATTEYLAACFLDMAWHGPDGPNVGDVAAFEDQVMAQINKIPQVDPRYKSCYFQHIFTGDDYSAGYYAYLWAEVLAADGFEAFRENGLFDLATARAFRQHILSKGAAEEPMTLYRRFRGREPAIQPLLRNRGLAPPVDDARAALSAHTITADFSAGS